MSADLSRLLNAIGLLGIGTVLALAFVDQLWFRDLPCPLCILQRAGFFAAGFGIALNLIFGPRPSQAFQPPPCARASPSFRASASSASAACSCTGSGAMRPAASSAR